MVAEKCSAVACLAFGTGKNINTLDAIPIQKGTWAETLKGFGLLRIEKGRICFSTAWQHPEKPAGGWIFMQGSSPRNDWKEKPSAVLFICLYLRTCFVLNVVFFSHLSFVVTGCSVWSAIAAEILKKLQCRNLLNGKPLDKKTPQRLQLFGPAGWQISYSNLIKMKQIEYFAFFFPFCVSTCIAAYPDCITSVQIIFYIGSASRIYTVEMHKAITCCPTQHQVVVNLLLNAYRCSWDTTRVSA